LTKVGNNAVFNLTKMPFVLTEAPTSQCEWNDSYQTAQRRLICPGSRAGYTGCSTIRFARITNANKYDLSGGALD